MSNCEKCNIQHDSTYGSGRFCSSKCARSFSTSDKREEINKKVSQKLTGRKNPREKKIYQYKCAVCNLDFSQNRQYDYRRGKAKCKDCRKKVIHHRDLSDINTMMKFSTRTISKIFKRAGIVCSVCGWNKTTLDTHHIIEKSKGGKDTHDNLVSLCPNCHRMAHEGQYTTKQLQEKTLDKIFKNWKDYYNPAISGNKNVKN